MIKLRGIYELVKNKIISRYIKCFECLTLGENINFKAMPHILVHQQARISIGKNTLINSSNFGYHLNMFSRCKLYADRANAQIIIGSNCRIHGTCIHAYNKITIGSNCLIAANTQIIDGNGHQLSMDNPGQRINTTDNGVPILIEDGVWIAANCIILGGTIIGEGSVITAGSVVKGIVPPKSLYGGNPAKMIKQYL